MPKFATMIRGQEQDLDFSIKYPMRQSGDKITLYRTQPREIVIELDKNTTEKEIEKLDIPKDVKEKLKDELSRLDYYLVVKYAESGNFSKALSIAETIDSVDDKSKAFHDIAVMYTRAGRNEKALKIADKIETADSKSWALIEIAGKYANTCDFYPKL